MRRVERLPESFYGLENSTVDSNRFYSILLDAKAASVSENMCDIAEKLLLGEKENAKIALEQLWNLKKNLVTDSNDTIDLLINFYQDKMDILRNNEDHIKKVSRDSRSLLEEKRKKDEEFASIKQQILDCNKELTDLNVRLEKLKIKEQELLLIEQQLKKELHGNENELVNGLYEIILAQQDENPIKAVQSIQPLPVTPSLVISPPPVSMVPVILAESEVFIPPMAEKTPEPPFQQEPVIPASGLPFIQEIVTFYPKSVVKTTKGRVIGEYFYDSKVYKNERHYIFNSRFFYEQLSMNIKLLKQRFDQNIFNEMLQMVEDAYKRITENSKLHFEISTNEILNSKSLKQLWHDFKLRSLDDVERFSIRLRAKIDALGQNYSTMLQEQMNRCTQK